MATPRSASTRRPTRRVHFLAKVLIGVLVFMWVPTIAQAAFSSRTAETLQIGTYSIPAPGAVTGTYSCNGSKNSMTVNISTFGGVDRATGYIVSLIAPSGQVTVNEVPADNRATTIARSTTSRGNFTLKLEARVGTWTGKPVGYGLACP